MKIAFLDRDGTLNKDYPDEDWRYVKEAELLDGTIEGLKKLIEKDFKIIIITNQYIISDGIISIKDYESFTDSLISKLSNEGIDILDIYFCPHNDSFNCNCKKPKPGMIENALKKYDIDMEASIYCGDSDADYLLAKYFNLRFFGINFNGNADVKKYNSILDIIEFL